METLVVIAVCVIALFLTFVAATTPMDDDDLPNGW